jgi:hypothetical protein
VLDEVEGSGGVMTVRAEDYRWLARSFPDFAVAHCVTVVVGRSPAQVLLSLGLSDVFDVVGLTAVEARAVDLWREFDGRQLLVAAVAMDNSTLMLEPNGYVGIEAAAKLSAGTTVVSFYHNVNALHQLMWVEDGRLSLDWDPLRPNARRGDRAISASPVLQASGFAFAEDDDADGLLVEASFAFAENVTGVRPTAGVLLNATFRCGIVAEPR